MTSRPVGRTARRPARVHGAAPELVRQLVAIEELGHFPGNARRHDLPTIVESLRVNGQYKPIIVQQATGYVLVGNGTLDAAIELGWTHVAVQWADVDDDQALRINLVDNRASELGGMDPEALLALIDAATSTATDLAGTGYDAGYGAQLERIIASLAAGPADVDAEWAGMPPYSSGDETAAFTVSVSFADEADYVRFFKLLKRQPGRRIWWPNDDGVKRQTVHQVATGEVAG